MCIDIYAKKFEYLAFAFLEIMDGRVVNGVL